jgi:branched-chain amino acid transport system ATP-binding protein
MADPILSVRGLGISFGGLKAVSNFDLEICEGELIGLIGPNGAGKTTIFNILTGVYQPTEGEFFFRGQRMNGKKTYDIVASGIARTFQNIRLFKQMTVLENVVTACSKDIDYAMPQTIFRTPRFFSAEAKVHARAMDLLTLFGLEDKADYIASNLPYGQQRKLEIARALATDMKLLLLDEPAAGMNPTETAELLESITLVREKFGIAILLIEHDMSLVMNICEKIMVIDYGIPIAFGEPAEIANNPKVITAYLGE